MQNKRGSRRRSAWLPHQVAHIIWNAQSECSAQVRIVEMLAAGLDHGKYNLHCCFLQSDGPLSADLQRIGVPTHVIGWNGRRTDSAAALNFIGWLRREEISILHQHGGGVLGRLLARAAGVKVNILHLHTPV